MAPQVLRAGSLARPAIDSAVVAVLAGIIVYTVAGMLLLGTWPIAFLPLLPLIALLGFLFGMPVAKRGRARFAKGAR